MNSAQNPIRIGIVGYGNLGRGTELAMAQNPDMKLVGIFTRRNPSTIKPINADVPVLDMDSLLSKKDEIDVLILCGGSATDLPVQGPELAQHFNIVDSFDTHADIPSYFAKVEEAAKTANKTAIISVGWDPGLFSINRLYAGAILPQGTDYTFWGKGVSQGHSDAIRRVEGVADGKQYTIPKDSALQAVREGKSPELTTREKHIRECFVVAKEGADLEKIKNEIVNMPNYFADYDTIVNFVSQDELNKDHSGIPHGGFVLRSGQSDASGKSKHLIEFSLKLDSNPEFTASVLVAYARANMRLQKHGAKGAFTVFDVPPAYLSPCSAEDLRKNLL